MDASKKYYRFAGMPLALQVWLYEYCSHVDSRIATRVKDEFDDIRKLINDKFNSLMDVNMDSDINKDKLEHMVDIHFDQREHIRSTDKSITSETPVVMPGHTAQTHVGDVHLEDLNMPPYQFELLDELLPSLNLERSIIVHPNANIQDEVTPLPMQRCR
ncbi:hypothetical protein HAX54_022319 [Datura stramonium]|uniref:Uncharacterized protein n=1 Tax=Datura stramonium TaxID=4076 RepID=A0ABS8UW61_DATST|nr:hypothetical protein [Datura stramonium]